MRHFLLTGLLAACLVPLAVPGARAGAAALSLSAPLLYPLYERSGSGVEAEIIEATLDECGLAADFHLQPYGRHVEAYEADPALAAAVTVIAPTGSEAYAFVYSSYQNSIITLRAKGIQPAKLADLAGRRVVSFPGAVKNLPGLDRAAARFGTYLEIANQDAHSRLILGGRVDAVIADRLIFAAYTHLVAGQAGRTDWLEARFDVASPFPVTNAYWVFRDAETGRRVHQCFNTISGNGILEGLIRERRRRFFGIYR